MMILTGDLGSTKTYSSRTWSWTGRIDPADLHDGTLTVNTVKGATGKAKVESRRYGVQEVPCDHGGRLFLLVKADGTPADPAPRDGEVYEVFVGEDGAAVTCTCKAGQCKVDNCVHRDAVPALVAAGAFDPPIDPPAAPPVTEEEIDDMAARHEAERSGLWFPADDDRDAGRACGLCELPMGGEAGRVHARCAAAEAAADGGFDWPECFKGIGPSAVGCPF